MCARKLQIETINEWKIRDLSKITFFKKKVKKKCKSHTRHQYLKIFIKYNKKEQTFRPLIRSFSVFVNC